MRQISLLKSRGCYRRRANDFTQGVLCLWRTRCSFVLFHPGAYNGTLQDQSSSHLSAVLEMPDRYFTTRSRFVQEILFFFFFFSVRVCALGTCMHVHAKVSLSQIFTLDFLIFAEAMMREPRVSRDDYSEWSREVPPDGANSTVRDCSASISSGAVLRPLSANHLFVWASALVAVRFSEASVNWEIYSFPTCSRWTTMHSWFYFIKIEVTNFLRIRKERFIEFACDIICLRFLYLSYVTFTIIILLWYSFQLF